ncbi:serine carboxypeptidase ctsa-4.1 [Trichonephila clavipes]|nr:serine carboxypeptidase ctsa-4.1 [Trichonephila clavipes]
MELHLRCYPRHLSMVQNNDTVANSLHVTSEMLLYFGLLSCIACIAKSTHLDEVKDLPGLDFPLNYKHYSGYLNASNNKYFHYWFFESQRSPSEDPLLLWMNGGPGCSSLDGLFTELGPLHVTDDGKKLFNNPYAWNRVANVIFLETPAGVGFSYSDNEKYATDDDTVSRDNYEALLHFFEKFPQFKKNEFYVTGESYGGIYVPTLSVQILKGPANINFKVRFRYLPFRMKMRVLNRSRQNDLLRVMSVLVHIAITPLHTPMPVSRRIGERTIS